MTTNFAPIRLAQIAVSNTATQRARRQRFDKDTLAELAESVKAHGILQPIIVRPRADVRGPKYELVAGERRLLAAELAALESIPAIVRDLSDEDVIDVQLIENLQRDDVHPMEEAEGYEQLRELGHPIDELHARVGKSRSYVYARLKLLALCPAARKAFYAGRLNASTALLLARIPSEKLQREALKQIGPTRFRDEPLSVRSAGEVIQRDFMLRLNEATFPTDDEKLNGKAGPCTRCPKRTGNQPELFTDVASADVCTDPPCFHAKTRAWGQRLLAEAKQRGQQVIKGGAAKQIAPYGVSDYGLTGGWIQLTAKRWTGNRHKTVKQIIGADVDVALLQCPKTGEVVEICRTSEVEKRINRGQKTTRTTDPATAAARRKQKLDSKVRLETYLRARKKLRTTPDQRTLARLIFGRLEHDAVKLLCTIRGFKPPTEKSYGRAYKLYDRVGRQIDTLGAGPRGLGLFINDCIYAQELLYGTRGYRPARLKNVPRLETIASKTGVSMRAVRAELAPKKKTKRKKKAKAKKKRAKRVTKKR